MSSPSSSSLIKRESSGELSVLGDVEESRRSPSAWDLLIEEEQSKNRAENEERKNDDMVQSRIQNNTPFERILRHDSVEMSIDEESIPFPHRHSTQNDHHRIEDTTQHTHDDLENGFDFDVDAMFHSLQMAILAQIQSENRVLSLLSSNGEPHITTTALNPQPMAITSADSSSIQSSPLSRLGGGRCEYFLSLNVLVFLSAEDLARLSRTSRFFSMLCSSPQLWHIAYMRDFSVDKNVERMRRARRNGGCHGHAAPLETRLFNRSEYVERLRDHGRRVLDSKGLHEQIAHDVQRLKHMDLIERVLDFVQLRTLAPVCMMSLFLSVVLFCRWNDGLDIPLWSCGIPVVFSVLYVMLALYLVYVVHDRQYTVDHVLRGFWSNLTGPLVHFYQEAMQVPSRLFYVVQGVLAMLVVQVGLVLIKLMSEVPHSFKNNLSWGIVFIPIWILFFLFVISPCTRFKVSFTTFVFVFFLFWVPLFILFACLTQKLDNENNMRMAFIMIPFYFIEGVVLVFSLGFLVRGVLEYRRGLLDRLDEYCAVFALSWLTLCPLVTFQALLAARDDNMIAHKRSFPSATEIATPLLIMLGWMTLVVSFACLSFKTKFEIARAGRLQESAGLRVIYKV